MENEERGKGGRANAHGIRSEGGMGSTPVRNTLIAVIILPIWMASKPARFVPMYSLRSSSFSVIPSQLKVTTYMFASTSSLLGESSTWDLERSFADMLV